MLVITRRNEERILIGPDIEVVIFGCGHQHCRVGIDAPPEVKILRKELAGRGEPLEASDDLPAVRPCLPTGRHGKGGGDGTT